MHDARCRNKDGRPRPGAKLAQELRFLAIALPRWMCAEVIVESQLRDRVTSHPEVPTEWLERRRIGSLVIPKLVASEHQGLQNLMLRPGWRVPTCGPLEGDGP